VLDHADIEGLVRLLNIDSKSDLEKYCRAFVVREVDFVALIIEARAGGLSPYLYACRFIDNVPPDLRPTDQDLAELSRNGIGPLQDETRKVLFKTFQRLFKERRQFAAHLFYTPDCCYWYLFYSDQRDEDTVDNHWQHGSHIHLISSHWPNLRLEEVWRRVKTGDTNFQNKIHLRFLSDDHQ
jgi:hypothetical protein